MLNGIFPGDTLATHAKLHKWGMLPLQIIIPENDLQHPISDLDLELETDNSVSCLLTCFTPQSKPNQLEASHCDESQSLFLLASQIETETELDEDVSDDDDADDGDEDDDEEESSQKKKQRKVITQIIAVSGLLLS